MSDEEPQDGKPARTELRRWGPPAAIAGVVIWFALANDERVPVDFVIFSRDARLIWVIVVSVVLGAALGWFASGRRRRKQD